MLASYAVAALLCVVAASIGLALLRLLRLPPAWSAPAVGLALLVAVLPVAIELPGHGITAAIVFALLGLGSLPLALRRGASHVLLAVPAGVTVALACGLPFLANWRFGPLGGAFNADIGAHLAWADAFRRGDEGVTIIPGYPVGAHALAGGLAGLLGTDALVPFTAILIGAPVLSALTAWGALPDLAGPRRYLAASVIALPFLVGGQYGQQAAFKELLMALFVLAATLMFVEARRDGDLSLRRSVPLGVLVAGAVSVYGLPAAYYAVALAGAWGASEVAQWVIREPYWHLRRLGAIAGAAAALAFALLAPQFGRLRELSAEDVAGVGNVPDYISKFALLGFWPSVDLRLLPADQSVRWAAGLLGLAVFAYASLWWLRRFEFLVPAMAAVLIAVHAVSEERGTPYIAAKTLAIAAPVVMLLCCRPLLADLDLRRRRPLLGVAFGAVATVYLAGVVWSSGLVLRNGAVAPLDRTRDLISLRDDLEGEPTLFLGHSYYAMWELQGARLSTHTIYAIPSQVPFVARPEKAIALGAATDFDSVEPSSLDRFRYVVTPISGFSSIPPPNWRRDRTSGDFVLWVREGTTPKREILDEGQLPAARMTCPRGGPDADPDRGGAVALVRRAPVVATAETWMTPEGGATYFDPWGYAAVAPGGTLEQTIRLRPGRWELSFQYASPRPLDVAIESSGRRLSVELEPMIYPAGDFWRVTDVDLAARGAVTISVTPEEPPLALGDMVRYQAVLGTLAATRVDERAVRVPLEDACRRYVDAYTARW